MFIKKNNKILLAYSTKQGDIYEYPEFESAFRIGKKFVRINKEDLIKLPFGSILFSLPKRYPVFYNHISNQFELLTHSIDGKEIWATSSFLSSGFLRTHLPAYIKKKNAPILSLWAYSGVVIIDGEFYIPGFRIDEDQRSDPSLHQKDRYLSKMTKEILKMYPKNRLIKQLSYCSTYYRCLCASNFFLGRYEAPIPASTSCNAKCLGCLSYQDKSGFRESQKRINFEPTPKEIAQVILHHVERVDNSVVSFGQGCEGEPLIRGKELAEAISTVRQRTNRGTININTNGSLPERVKLLIDSGLDSIRISLNSPTIDYYNRYFRPINYTFNDVMKTLEITLKSGIFTSLNLFFLPGFTDMETETYSLFQFLNKFPVNMIQTRNLNMDPDYYLDNIKFRESNPIGIKKLIKLIMENFPSIKIGYYNPPKEISVST